MTINSSDESLFMRHLPRIAAGSVLALTLVRLWLAGQTELIPEEAYYWAYAQHPSLGYFDHPPMVAWLIALGTALFGNTELGVRAAAIALLWPGSAGLVFLAGRAWFGSQAAAVAVLLFCLSPIFVGIGLIMTPDAPLIFFWLLTLYAITQALRSGRAGFWWLAGIGFGCALLSKYTAAMLAGSLFLFLCLSPNYRRWLLRREPWLALAAGIAVFSPVIIWNAQHQWASFLFQSTRAAVEQHEPIREAGTFWAYQLGALTPFLLALYAYALVPAIRRGWIRREDRWNFSMSFALPLFAVFVLASFKNKGHVNWTAPAYLSWTFAAAAVFLELRGSWRKHRAALYRLAIWTAVAFCIGINAIQYGSLAWGVPRVFALSNAGGWRGLAAEVGKAREDLARRSGKQPFIIGADKLNTAAEMGFYLEAPGDLVNDYALGGHGLAYRYWVDLQKLKERPAVVVIQKNKLGPNSLAMLKANFERVDEPVLLPADESRPRWRQAYLVNCYGYRALH
jgi:dolichol-phosphate mannosyltransferase